MLARLIGFAVWVNRFARVTAPTPYGRRIAGFNPLPVACKSRQTTPNASIASATFLKPAMFAPFT